MQRLLPQLGFRRWRPALVIGVMLGCLPSLTLAADGQLATTKLQKAAVTCQKVIAQVSAKVLAQKLKALDACANAALVCVQTKQDQADCLAKAGQTCATQLSKAAADLGKAQAKIVAAKSCATELRLPDLLSADGLGLGQVAAQCQNDFGLDVCGGLDPLAECLVRSHERAAGVLYGTARPRTEELLTLLPDVTLPVVEGLPAIPGCGQCSVTTANRKAVEQCGRALTATTQSLVAKLEGEIGACAQKVLGCVQTKSDAPECSAKARASCDKGANKIAKAIGTFATAIAKKCGTGAVDFGQIAGASGLGLEALVDACVALGTSAPTNTQTLAQCLQQRAQCTVADLVQQAVARVGDFNADGRLGSLGSVLTPTCSSVAPLSSRNATLGERLNLFGSISKFIKQVQRPKAGVFGVKTAGGRPAPGIGIRGVTRIDGQPRIAWGAIVKIPFHYTLGATHTGSSREQRADTPPPSLVLAVQREGTTFEDHFEIPLDATAAGTDVADELEVAYQDTLPDCTFTLALAIRDGGVVTEYAPLLQVVDTTTPAPVVTTTPIAGTPTAIATATETPAATATATPTETPTEVATPTLTPTTSESGTPTETATPTPTSPDTATPTETATPPEAATPTGTETPIETDSPTPTATDSDTPTPTPTATPSRFIDNGDGTVTDTETGLQWEKKTTTVGSGSNFADPHDVDNQYAWCLDANADSACDDPGSSPDGPPMDGPLATQFIAALNTAPCFANHCDWRIPTVGLDGDSEELETIIDAGAPGCGVAPCIASVFGPTGIAFNYWSATTLLVNSDGARNVDFHLMGTDVPGDPRYDNDFKYHLGYARAVRGPD